MEEGVVLKVLRAVGCDLRIDLALEVCQVEFTRSENGGKGGGLGS